MSLTSMQGHLECPVCFELFERVALCKTGHSVCITCGNTLDRCPICREEYLAGARNFCLEDVIRDFKALKLSLLQSAKPTEAASPNPPAAAAATTTTSAALFLCRVNGCGVRVPLDYLHAHLRSDHKNKLDEYTYTFEMYKKSITYTWNEDVMPKDSSLYVRYLYFENAGLYSLRIRRDSLANRNERYFCWMQRAVSTDREAQQISFQLTVYLSDNRTAEYSDYMHGEQSNEVDIMSKRQCLFWLLPHNITVIQVDLRIFKTMRGLGASRRAKTKWTK